VQISPSVVQAPVTAFSTDMSLPEHVGKPRLGRWCALVVLLAVCSLTLSLITRYSTAPGISIQTAKSLHAHAAPTAKKQHLAKDAADWIPPVVRIQQQVPTSYRPLAAVSVPILSCVSEQSLYTRPPPSSDLRA
jgi:hypothetical protein